MAEFTKKQIDASIVTPQGADHCSSGGATRSKAISSSSTITYCHSPIVELVGGFFAGPLSLAKANAERITYAIRALDACV
jgi:cytochrome c551/c552